MMKKIAANMGYMLILAAILAAIGLLTTAIEAL